MTISRFAYLAALVVVLSAGATSEISAQTADEAMTGDEVTFEVGGSCAALAYLNAAQLHAFISAGYSDDFHSFCFPEEPSECSDYTSFLKGIGHLSTGDDGYHCSLQLQQ